MPQELDLPQCPVDEHFIRERVDPLDRDLRARRDMYR
jgi:hypothetical protein